VSFDLAVWAEPVPVGELIVEHRDGSPDRHRRVVVTDLRLVVTAFQQYARGDGAWRTALPWERYDVPSTGG
jgi:hypothetical protein